jgi:hypothetical protein
MSIYRESAKERQYREILIATAYGHIGLITGFFIAFAIYN